MWREESSMGTYINFCCRICIGLSAVCVGESMGMYSNNFGCRIYMEVWIGGCGALGGMCGM